MAKEKIFDEEVTISISTSTGDSTCSSASITRKIMLRITTEAGSDVQRGFELEIYDESNVDFLYSGQFTHSKFNDMRQKQGFTFNIDEAPKKIISFVKDLKQDSNKFINCSLCETLNKDRSFCRFELITHSEFKDICMMSLELKKAQGEQLNAHLISFIEKYKRKSEEVPTLRKQFENIQIEYKKVREELKSTKEHNTETIQELTEKNDMLMDEVRAKAEEARHLSNEFETLEADLKSLKAAYKNQLQEIQDLTADNERFVNELDDGEAEIAALQSQLKENMQQKEEFCKRYKTVEGQLKTLKGSTEQYKSKLVTSEYQRKVLEEELSRCQELLKTQRRELADALRNFETLTAEKEQLGIEIDGLRTHVELLNTQLKETQQKKNLLFKNRLQKQ